MNHLNFTPLFQSVSLNTNRIFHFSKWYIYIYISWVQSILLLHLYIYLVASKYTHFLLHIYQTSTNKNASFRIRTFPTNTHTHKFCANDDRMLPLANRKNTKPSSSPWVTRASSRSVNAVAELYQQLSSWRWLIILCCFFRSIRSNLFAHLKFYIYVWRFFAHSPFPRVADSNLSCILWLGFNIGNGLRFQYSSHDLQRRAVFIYM